MSTQDTAADDPQVVASAIVALLDSARAVVSRVEVDEAQHGGLLGRDSLREVGRLRLQLARWSLPARKAD